MTEASLVTPPDMVTDMSSVRINPPKPSRRTCVVAIWWAIVMTLAFLIQLAVNAW